MTELQRLIKEQQEDDRKIRIYDKKENHTLIRPHKYRFNNFAGDNPKEQAYCVLVYLGWDTKEIITALRLSITELTYMTSIFGTTKNPDNHQKFYLEIPAERPRDKAILILRGLNWKFKDIEQAIGITRDAIVKRLNKFMNNR